MTEAQATIERYKAETTEMLFCGTWHGITKHDAYLHAWSGSEYQKNIKDFDKKDFETWKSAQIEHAEELAIAGATYLDENYPGWRDSISAQNLDMASGSQCILGQFFGDYDEGIEQIWKRDFYNEYDQDSDVARDHGFLENGACYMALDLAWQKELLKR